MLGMVLSTVALPVTVIIILLSAHLQNGAAFQSTGCNWRRTSQNHRAMLLDSSSCADNDIFVQSDDDDGSDNTTYAVLHRRLHLTTDEAARIQNRISGITPKKKQQKYNHNEINNIEVTAVEEQQAVVEEQNLTYLEEHLGMTTEQLRRTVVGYPLVLKMKTINLMSSVEFFVDAFWDDSSSSGDFDDNETIPQDSYDDHKRRVSAFLCESPQLLEYNVNKRLKPRLERLRKAQEKQSEEGHSAGGVDEETLRSVATLTDSRFETWLEQQTTDASKSSGGGSEEITTKGSKLVPPQQRQPINNPSAYVIVSNLQSGGNIGNIVRSASIFGCEECIVVGQKRFRMTGDHGSRLDLPQRHMWTHADVKEYLDEKRVRIYGIEIMENASPIMQYDRETGVVTFPFQPECEGGWSGSAFIFGNEGQGLSTKQREICDEFLFIPQNRGGSRDSVAGREKVGSASMNVACAAAVVLQAYSMWAGYSGARFEGEKFLT